MPQLLCAFDLGTNGVKAGLFTPEGRLLGQSYREYGVECPECGWVEQSIERMWQAQCETAQALLAATGVNAHEIAAIGVSSQRATFAPLDAAGRPLSPFIGWQDHRSLLECEWMAQRVSPRRYYDIAGLPLEPTAAVSKILWLKRHNPALFERTAVFGSTQNIHLAQLGAENPPCDLADAGYLGLLDVDRFEWSRELLEAFELPRQKLPELAPSGTRVGSLSAAAAEATGLAAGTPLVLAGGDLQVAGVGMGVAAPGVISLGIGSGGGVLIYLERPLRHAEIGLNCQPHAVPDAWEMEGICLASGASYKWFREVLGEPERRIAAERGCDPYDVLTELAAQAEIGAGGLLFLPALAGSGAPNWYPQARGMVLGLTLATQRSALVRSLLEGICLEIRGMLEAAGRMGTPVSEVRIWGGAAKSPFWNQMAADVYGIPAARTAISEAGLAGAAICAGVGVGLYRDVHEGVACMVQIEERYEPVAARHRIYDELYEIYDAAYRAMKDSGVFARLSAFHLPAAEDECPQ
jgi:xylulokinase